MPVLAAAANATQLPNPYTPMAFLPPIYAKTTTIHNYAIIGSLAVSGQEPEQRFLK